MQPLQILSRREFLDAPVGPPSAHLNLDRRCSDVARRVSYRWWPAAGRGDPPDRGFGGAPWQTCVARTAARAIPRRSRCRPTDGGTNRSPGQRILPHRASAAAVASPPSQRDAAAPGQHVFDASGRLTRLSLQQIGACFGGRDHSTVLHACRKIEAAIQSDTALSGAVDQMHAELT